MQVPAPALSGFWLTEVNLVLPSCWDLDARPQLVIIQLLDVKLRVGGLFLQPFVPVKVEGPAQV